MKPHRDRVEYHARIAPPLHAAKEPYLIVSIEIDSCPGARILNSDRSLNHKLANVGDQFAMGLLSDFFIADPTPVPHYDGGESLDDADKCQFKNLTPLQAAQFLAVLRSQDYVVEMIREFELVTPEDAEDWTMTVPDDMVTALASIDTAGIADVASHFADATREELAWSADDFVPIVSALSALAKRALATNKKMYLWNCL